MKNRTKRTSGWLLLTITGLILCTANMEAKPASGLSVTVTVTPELHIAPCPVHTTFTATIIGDPYEIITYQWKRSDGAITSTFRTQLDNQGRATITKIWVISSTFNGWQSMKVTQADGTVTESDYAEFAVTCTRG